MKIERISENQIRCTLSSFDLSVRNLNLGELAYGSEKARSLFREMIQKASNEVGFEAEDIPLMVEAIPLSNESVMLVITKIEDPEELDTRFSKFAPPSEDSSDSFLSELANELLEGVNNPITGLSDGTILDSQNEDEASEDADLKKKSAVSSIRIYRFDSLDQVSEAAKVVGQVYQGLSTLYKKPNTKQYYLVLNDTAQNTLEFSRICNVLTEYAVKIRHEAASEAYYQEHYEIITKDKALQVLEKI